MGERDIPLELAQQAIDASCPYPAVWRCRSCDHLICNSYDVCVVCGTARADEPEEQIPEALRFRHDIA